MSDDLTLGRPEDRRQHKRFRTSLHVAVANNYSLAFETAIEVGQGGMLLRTHGLPILNQNLELRFFLPNKEFVFIKGEVVYRLKHENQYYAGVRFTSNSAELTQWLSQLKDLQL